MKLLKFENLLPTNCINLLEFERRVKKLVYKQEFITETQLLECFKTLRGFEDLDSEFSASFCTLTSQYITKSSPNDDLEEPKAVHRALSNPNESST